MLNLFLSVAAFVLSRHTASHIQHCKFMPSYGKPRFPAVTTMVNAECVAVCHQLHFMSSYSASLTRLSSQNCSVCTSSPVFCSTTRHISS